MEHSCIQLDDLPDEIILIILKKLNNCDVLYSLIGVNRRLDAIVNDSIFTRNLTLIPPLNKRFHTMENNSIFPRSLTLITPFNGLSYQFNDTIVDRFCLRILPKINDKIQRLTVESSSMKRILLATNYPNLHTLGIYDLAPEVVHDVFSGKIFSSILSMIILSQNIFYIIRILLLILIDEYQFDENFKIKISIKRQYEYSFVISSIKIL